jgi:glycosyltransferase involved in cell wall biosynthesis
MFFTEIWAGPLLRRLAPGTLRAMACRWHEELENAKVVSWNAATLFRNARWLPAASHTSLVTPYSHFTREGRWFSEKVRDHLARRGGDLRGAVVFSYDTTALELFGWAKERGAFSILGQMDAGRVEAEVVSEEEQRWSGWACAAEPEVGTDGMEEFFQRREAEWGLADRIIVNSRWSFEALVKQGVAAKKMAVVPLCYEPETGNRRPTVRGQTAKSTFGRLRVIFLGQVILRKGIQYLIEAARLLTNEPVQFDVVGPVGISAEAVSSAPTNLTFHGRVNRDEAANWYQRADVFVLPTLSDGFALTQLEAMAHGLPVIATPNCGEVVTEGVDGFVVPARDAFALAQAIRCYLADPELLNCQRDAALEKSRQFSLDTLVGHLQKLEDSLPRQVEAN